jgi:hypothetical protein
LLLHLRTGAALNCLAHLPAVFRDASTPCVISLESGLVGKSSSPRSFSMRSSSHPSGVRSFYETTGERGSQIFFQLRLNQSRRPTEDLVGPG